MFAIPLAAAGGPSPRLLGTCRQHPPRRIHRVRAGPDLGPEHSKDAKPRRAEEPAKADGRGGAKALENALSAAADTWARLDTQQRLYTVLSGAALLVVGPKLLAVLLIPLERLLVGGLLALEEVVALLLLQGARLVGLVGLAALVLTGAYLFLFKRERS
ncbi:hypothetical protein TSOC_006906 [Tetrabaena socialis]|uniref:Uncharacterized protein n=1 Tax=Tetrabaena socialis TaxID=47790 RepID=A0A2J8A2E3_9CHLO|nr:hypothetical protein TSOC_006906 [Tetrabaena socialis]|eukprot:PNH06689.1 hypothetical protein TSOC_006906 [Tetrabaena socialis]